MVPRDHSGSRAFCDSGVSVKLLFAGNKTRGVRCMHALLGAGHRIVGVLAHPDRASTPVETVAGEARQLGLPVLQPHDVHDPALLAEVASWGADLGVLAGYSPIVGSEFIAMPRHGCINLHGGQLPEYRGSSPMNWALINGESEVTLSIIQVDHGVDSGDVLSERAIPVAIDDSIADVDRQANDLFPKMLVEVVASIADGTVMRRREDERLARYFPLRFPDDGLILWDSFTAMQVHNRIRALTDPFPGAYTLFNGRRVKLLRSKLPKTPVFGEPGRVYRKSEHGLLVCASDQCVWVQQAVVEETGGSAFEIVSRYDVFATLRGLALTAGQSLARV
jgi:methionyl-tRNA formyltransferase